MSTIDKPLALKLADLYTAEAWPGGLSLNQWALSAASELRRLAEVEQERDALRAEVERLIGYLRTIRDTGMTAGDAAEHAACALRESAPEDSSVPDAPVSADADPADSWAVIEAYVSAAAGHQSTGLVPAEVLESRRAAALAVVARAPAAPAAQPLTRVEIRQTAAGFEARGVAAVPAAQVAAPCRCRRLGDHNGHEHHPLCPGDTAPVAWLYTLEYGSKVADTKVSRHQLNYPFGVCGADYLRSNADGTSYVRQVPLYAAQPAAERAHGIAKEGGAA